jgi:hypothetical protein
MPTYLISYDLDKPGPKNYERLDNWLRAAGAVRVLYSQWVLKYGEHITVLEKQIMGQIDPDTDNVLVVRMMPGESAWNRLMISDDQFRALIAR